MALILLIETATTSCSVALALDGYVLAVKQINERNKHAEAITIFINDVVTGSGYTFPDLDAVAVSCGPGSYTGLRIGTSVAKGLCFALNIPLIAIETLEAMAYGAIYNSGLDFKMESLFCPMIDARRMEVYCAVFNSQGDRVVPTTASIIDENSFIELLSDHEVLFFGDGADKCRSMLGEQPHARFLSSFENSAKFLSQKASQKYLANDFVDVAYFEPFYLKDFIAGKKVFTT